MRILMVSILKKSKKSDKFDQKRPYFRGIFSSLREDLYKQHKNMIKR